MRRLAVRVCRWHHSTADGVPYVCGTTSMPKVRWHADLRHTLALGLLGHGSACVTDLGVRMCGCGVRGLCGCVVWLCVLRSHTLQGTVSVCWHKVPGVLSWSTPMATTTAVVNPPSCADGSALRMLGHATGCHLSLASGNVSTAVPTAGGGYILSQGGVYMFKCVCGHAH